MTIRTSASIISFKKKAEEIWGLKGWEGIDDLDQELLFFGLFNDRDYAVFDNFKGKKSVFWAGSDILNALGDYERRRVIKNYPDTKHYCENEIEAEGLRSFGLDPIVVPSFLDNIDNYPITFKPSEKPHIFLCGHPEREGEYGFGIVKSIAEKVPFATFHLYGVEDNSSYFKAGNIIKDSNGKADDELPNVIYHGKVPQEQFNKEIQGYHCGLRTNDHDGFSEVTAKSLLYGGYPITKIKYEGIWNYNTEAELVALIEKLRTMKEPNTEVRELYKSKLNKYPWLTK